MIQALIATIVELVSLMFAISAGLFLEKAQSDSTNYPKATTCIVLMLIMAACALGVAAR